MALRSTGGPAFQHLALMVRDIEASHRFYTDSLGFKQIGELGPHFPMKMRSNFLRQSE